MIRWCQRQSLQLWQRGIAHEQPSPERRLTPDAEEGLLTEPVPDVAAALAAIASLTAGNKILPGSNTTVGLGNDVIESGSIVYASAAICAAPVPCFKNGAPKLFPRLLFRYKLCSVDPMKNSTHLTRAASQVYKEAKSLALQRVAACLGRF